MANRAFYAMIIVASAMLLGACADKEGVEYNYPSKTMGRYDEKAVPPEERETIFGKGGINLFGNKKGEEAGGGGIGVNSFLWRATLDTLAFMPLHSADPFGGVVITDWYSPQETPTERFKINAFILSRSLRADGVKVTTFRQTRGANGEWVDASVDPQTATGMENAILTRARQLRIATTAP